MGVIVSGDDPGPWSGDGCGVDWDSRSLEVVRVDGVHGTPPLGNIGDRGRYAVP
jgi:hypothetical protein